jgi:hypothetical protein
VNILFLGRHYTYFRNFESVLQQLASRGHAIHLAVEHHHESFGGLQMVEALASRYPSVTYGQAPSRDSESDWSWVATRLRLGLDYLRYQHPLFDDAPRLRERARYRAPGAFITLGRLATVSWLRGVMARAVRAVERAIPEEPAIRGYLEARRPDVVLITPLVDLGSSQIDYLRAARALRIPTAVCVWSWDHLSSKALIRDWPDRLFVWNATQQREAEALHGVPPSRIVVTGAQCFDQWFDRQPSRDRAAFCAAAGLPADRPLLLYVCSALFAGSPVEAGFVERWLRALRASGSPVLRDCSVLVRPHPSRLPEWEGVDLSGLQPVAVWGSNPVTSEARADYFDSLHYASAVVGLNTSAFIEAAIVGTPAHTLLLPEYADNQTGTVHFNYLLNVGGGLLHVARDFDAHARQLEQALTGRERGAEAFVREFVRPLGMDVPATPVFVREVEALASLSLPVPGLAPARLESVWRASAGLLARTRHAASLEPLVYSERERIKLRAESDSERRRAARAEERAERRASHAALKAERMRLRAEQDARKKQDKLDARRRRKEAAAAERRAPHAKAGGVGPGAH